MMKMEKGLHPERLVPLELYFLKLPLLLFLFALVKDEHSLLAVPVKDKSDTVLPAIPLTPCVAKEESAEPDTHI